MRQGKHYMIILYRKQFTAAGFYPLLFFDGTTLGAMPVTATMILIFYFTAFIIYALI
jgi:hypothetical protein